MMSFAMSLLYLVAAAIVLVAVGTLVILALGVVGRRVAARREGLDAHITAMPDGVRPIDRYELDEMLSDLSDEVRAESMEALPGLLDRLNARLDEQREAEMVTRIRRDRRRANKAARRGHLDPETASAFAALVEMYRTPNDLDERDD